MTTFKDIRGTAIQSLSSDPSNPEVGQIWYNNTIGVLKDYQLVAASWAAGGNLSTARAVGAGFGTQTAAAYGGGDIGGSPRTTNVTEEYNGSTWSPSGNMGTARFAFSGVGTQTAGLAFGGLNSAADTVFSATEEYDGSTWSPGGNLNTARNGLGGAGIQTAGLAFGGSIPPLFSATTNVTEEYDGSAWTSGGNLGTSRRNLSSMGTGIQTAALAIGGFIPPATRLSSTEEYDGSAWTAGGSLNTARLGMACAGTQTASFAALGDAPPFTLNTELYDGTTWTSSTPATGPARATVGGAGSVTAGLAFGGENSVGYQTATEEFTGAALGVQKITTS
jgi:hypothetical protein